MYKRFFGVLGVASLVLAGCNEDPTGPGSVPCDNFLLDYGQAGADTVTTTGGVRYIDVEEGSGAVAATNNNVATVNFSGYYASPEGAVIPGATSCGASTNSVGFHVGSGQFVTGGFVIEGFSIGVLGMQVGGVRRVIIPAAYAWGEDEIPGDPVAGQDVIFDLHLVRLQ